MKMKQSRMIMQTEGKMRNSFQTTRKAERARQDATSLDDSMIHG